MMVTIRTSLCFSFLVCLCLRASYAAPVGDHNSTRSNKGTIVVGGGDLTAAGLKISNEKVVRKRPGRTTFGNLAQDAEMGHRGSGTVKFFNNSKGFGFVVADQDGVATIRNSDPISGLNLLVEKDQEDSARENSLAMFHYQLLLEGASDSEAGEYGLIAALVGDATECQSALDLDDKIVRKKPGRVGDGVGFDSGSGNHGFGTLRNNDSIPGIDIIVEKDPEASPSLDNSLLMMLNHMLGAGCSQAEVIEFALLMGLSGS